LFNNLGIQWAGTLLGCVAAVLVPIPVYFWFYGFRLRLKSQFAPVLDNRPAPSNENNENNENHGELSRVASVDEEGSELDTPS
jgi:DHA1 family multidrug resistance protein-like MFS transporter